MENNDQRIFKATIDNIYYFKQALTILKLIKNEVSLCLNDTEFYINECTEDEKLEFFIIVEAISIKSYIVDTSIIGDDKEIYFGFQCNEFIKKIGKIGKNAVGIIFIDKEGLGNNNGKLNLIFPSSTGEKPQINPIDIKQTDIMNNVDCETYKSILPNLKVSTTDFCKLCEKIANCKCSSLEIEAYESFMECRGKIEEKDEVIDEFGTPKMNYIIEGETPSYPRTYLIDTKGIEILVKFKTLSSGTKLKFFFLENKLVIKSKLSSIGKVIFTSKNVK